MTKTATEILRNFDTCKFRRDHTQDKARILELIDKSLLEDTPLKFVKYWGKGVRDQCGEIEEQALDFLVAFFDRMDIKTELTIIYTDTHIALNGYSSEGAIAYLESLRELLENYDFELLVMSDYVIHSSEQIDGMMADSFPDPELKKELEKSSQKRYKGGSYEEGAHRYYIQNIIENEFMEQEFNDSVFLTYNGPALNNLLPDLPKFYMHSIKKGKSEKPWFM